MRLTWYPQNPRYLDGHHTYVTSENDTNIIERKEVWHKLTTQEVRGVQYHQISIGIQKYYYLQYIILKKLRRELTHFKCIMVQG